MPKTNEELKRLEFCSRQTEEVVASLLQVGLADVSQQNGLLNLRIILSKNFEIAYIEGQTAQVRHEIKELKHDIKELKP